MLALVVATLLLQQAPGTPSAPPAPPPAAGPRATPPPAPRAPQALPPPRAAEPLRGDWPKEPSGKRISLEDTTSIDDALEAIAEAAGWNVVLNTGREGNKLLVLRLRDVPVEDALRAALQGTDLVATRRASTVVIAASAEAVEPRPVLSGFDKPTGKRFTGDFEQTPAGEALRKIAKAGGLSIVLPPGDAGNVNASFQGVPVEDALRAVLEQAGLAAERQGTLLVVSGRGPAFGPDRLRRGLPPDIGRHVDEAMRQAEREVRRAEREMDRVGGDRDRVVNGDVVIRPGEHARDIVAIRGSVKLESGAEARDVVAILGSVTLAGGSRAREVTAVLGGIQVGPGAEIEGNATSVGGKITVDPGAEIGGEQTGVDVPGVSGITGILGPKILWGSSESGWFGVAQVLARFATYFALGLLLVALFPRRVDGVAASMVASPWKAILVGVLGTV
ncbi:MAG TPA: secretin and TonB N-terminal domain-containing protein, partial [Anaeromyxobacter sp.]